MFYAVLMRKGLSLGILMNTRGMMEIIVLDIALDKKYSKMVLMSELMMTLVTPLTMMVHGQIRRFAPYKRRTLQKGRPDAELSYVWCCVFTPQGLMHVPSIISLLDISNPSKNSPFFVYGVWLVC
ncbi:Cation/H(+) antiporter [Zostera marina]|uniref:Cation/H(+) antiporter n=1 Tax=Zostera marina TaxID=29655 RepID=A0A0K9PKQ6_ZOSMR|nr:Cation/H(+) antiporter [Zostera marina]